MEADEGEQALEIGTITLAWSEWVKWTDLETDGGSNQGVEVPEKDGVYEVKREDEEQRLTIGRSGNLDRRVKKWMVNGNPPHSAGCKILANEDTSGLQVRWATTNRPAAAEEELHRLHVEDFEKLPEYTKHT